MEYPPRSLELTSLGFYLWGTPKALCVPKKINELQDLRHKVKTACAAILLKKYMKCDILLYITVNNVLFLVVDIWNI